MWACGNCKWTWHKKTTENNVTHASQQNGLQLQIWTTGFPQSIMKKISTNLRQRIVCKQSNFALTSLLCGADFDTINSTQKSYKLFQNIFLVIFVRFIYIWQAKMKHTFILTLKVANLILIHTAISGNNYFCRFFLHIP